MTFLSSPCDSSGMRKLVTRAIRLRCTCASLAAAHARIFRDRAPAAHGQCVQLPVQCGTPVPLPWRRPTCHYRRLLEHTIRPLVFAQAGLVQRHHSVLLGPQMLRWTAGMIMTMVANSGLPPARKRSCWRNRGASRRRPTLRVKAGLQVALVHEVGSLGRAVSLSDNGGDWETLPWPGHRYRS